MGWVTVERRLGYFGKCRDEIHGRYDGLYGSGRWRIAFELGGLTLELAWMLQIYEDAYFLYLRANPDVLEQLVRGASDVYDDDPRNVESGLDYTIQQTNRNHYQDTALRRCLVRLGRRFEGSQLIQIRDSRGEHPLSLILSPGRIPFHLPQLVSNPLAGWWEPGSVEEAYQAVKVLQVWGD